MNVKQLTDLAALLGITPETHRQLRLAVYKIKGDPKPYGPQVKVQGVDWVLDPDKLPNLTDLGADLVWLAPMMEKLKLAERSACIDFVYDRHDAQYRYRAKIEMRDWVYRETMSEALYLAAQAEGLEGFEAPLGETNNAH